MSNNRGRKLGLRSRVERFRESGLLLNTVSLLAGSWVRLLLQAAYFVLIARSLGVEQYGAFVGVLALAAILAPFAPLGRGQLLIRDVARAPRSFGQSWGNALIATCVCGSFLVLVVLTSARFVLGSRISPVLVLSVAISELLLAAVTGVSAQAFQAVEQLYRTAQIYVVLSGSRAVFALVLFLFVHRPTATLWGICYCVSSLISAVYSVSFVKSKLGRPRLSLQGLKADFVPGIYFAVGLASQSIYNDTDKTLLSRLSSFTATGIYAIAYRVLDLVFEPVGALLWSAYPKFFRHGKNGLEGTTAYAKQLLPYAVGYSFGAGAVLYLTGPMLPLILGKDFAPSVQALRWLSPILVFRAIHYFLSHCLTGADFQGLRSAIQMAVAVFNVLLNLWLIPAFSWRGAAWASLASDGALGLSLFIAIVVLQWKRTIEVGCAQQATSMH